MRIRILKHLISIFGSMEPGAIHEIPDDKARSWIRSEIAEPVDEAGNVIRIRPDVIPVGMFWCKNHNTLHNIDSKIGEACQGRVVKEEEERNAVKREALAKSNAEQEAAELEAAEAAEAAEAKAKAEEEAEEAKRLAEEAGRRAR